MNYYLLYGYNPDPRGAGCHKEIVNRNTLKYIELDNIESFYQEVLIDFDKKEIQYNYVSIDEQEYIGTLYIEKISKKEIKELENEKKLDILKYID